MAQDEPEDFRTRKFNFNEQSYWLWLVALIFILIFFIAFRTLALQPIDNEGNTNELAFITNVVTEAMSIFITVLIIDQIQKQRDDRRQAKEHAELEQIATNRLQKELLADIRHGHNVDAIRAINRMRDYGWLEGDRGLLIGVDLTKSDLANANLSGANLYYAQLGNVNLQGADLTDAVLKKAYLYEANLADATLYEADLRDTNLNNANLKNACLYGVDFHNAKMVMADLRNTDLKNSNLQNTRLQYADLRETNLLFANLKGAKLAGAKFSMLTILPKPIIKYDSTTLQSYDESMGQEQMRQYTDPNHSDFWQPYWVKQQGIDEK
ncbi:MAG: pentapeptide repeat-containing protein [Anaerolineae bacterium]|nr:pentapeptide repeat-containing protein [Anaerolineae bacterium]